MANPIVDFSKFKKTSDNAQEAVMAHPDGHRIHLTKKGLSQDILKQLKALPLHQAEPEEPVQPTATEDSSANLQSQGILPPQPAGPFGVVNDATGPAITDAIRAKEDQDQVSAQATLDNQPPAPVTAPIDPNADIKAMAGGAQQLAGNAANTASLTEQAKTVAGAEHANAVHAEAAYQGIKRDLEEKKGQIDAATDDLRKGHINSNQYLESKSTAGRVATAIGLLLGGISSGQTGQPNPALTFLNKQIENNLEAQKSNLANKHNLLSALQQQYGDRLVAENMFRAINANHLASQVAEAAAKSMGGQAKAAGQIFEGQLHQTADQYRKMATLNQLRSSLNGAATPGFDSKVAAYRQVAQVMDPKGLEEFEKHYIPDVGVSTVPIEPKDRDLLAKKTELSGLLKRADDVLANNKGFGALPLTQKHAEAQSIQNQIQLRMGELADLTRFTPEENKIYKQTTPDLTGTHFTGKDQALLKSLRETNDGTLNTFYKQKGINRTAGDTDTVKVIGPDGRSGSIPKVNLGRALKTGYKQVQ